MIRPMFILVPLMALALVGFAVVVFKGHNAYHLHKLEQQLVEAEEEASEPISFPETHDPDVKAKTKPVSDKEARAKAEAELARRAPREEEKKGFLSGLFKRD